MGDTIQLTTNGVNRSRHWQTYYRVNSNSFAVRIKAQSNVIIRLTQEPSCKYEYGGLYEIHLGTENNMCSKIIFFDGGTTKASANTPDILSDRQYRGFWIKFANKKLSVYAEDATKPFMECMDNSMPKFKFISFKNKTLNSNAYWMFEVPPKILTTKLPLRECEDVTWETSVDGQLPNGAFLAAIDDHPLYVARAHHQRSLTPGLCARVIPHALIAWGGSAHEKNEFEVLCGYKLRWLPTHGEEEIPESAIPGGTSETGEPLYIGRAIMQDGHIRLGKVQPSHRVCYVPYKRKEVAIKTFELLVNYQEPIDDDNICRVFESDEEQEYIDEYRYHY